MNMPQCSVISLTDTELMALVRCAARRLVVIAPGLSESVARALGDVWRRLGPDKVQVVLDSDPEVCRLGFGEVSALEILRQTAEELGTEILQQQGLRVGVVITDETTTIYSPTPLLVEAGGQPGERQNAIRLEAPGLRPSNNDAATGLAQMNLEATPISKADVQRTVDDLKANPPMKFDLAQKVRVFNAQFEFAELKLRGMAVSRKTVPIPSDLMNFAKDPKTQKLLKSSFHLIAENTELSGKRIEKLRQFIDTEFLRPLPGYGTVVLRKRKSDFEAAVKVLERYVQRFQKILKKRLQAEVDANRELVASALLPGVLASPPTRWRRFLGGTPNPEEARRLLQSELTKAFGSIEDVIRDMKVKVMFKGVTYESLSSPEFMRVAHEAIPELGLLHEEFDAAKAGSGRK
jgi:hypothetical protein